MIKSKTKLWYS